MAFLTIDPAPMTWYITLTAPEGCPALIPAQPVLAFLAEQPELHAEGAMVFGTRPGQPWGQVVLARMNEHGGYHVDGSLLPDISVIELICSSHHADPQWYDRLAARIAAYLSWQAVEEHAQRRMWPVPSGQP